MLRKWCKNREETGSEFTARVVLLEINKFEEASCQHADLKSMWLRLSLSAGWAVFRLKVLVCLESWGNSEKQESRQRLDLLFLGILALSVLLSGWLEGM